MPMTSFGSGALVTAIAAAALALPAQANPTASGTTQTTAAPAAAPTLIAQSLVGQCRAAKYSTPIFAEQNPTSPGVRLLSTNQQVTLAGDGAGSEFIQVSSPANGYVYKVNLKTCSTNPGPGPDPAPSSRCRRVLFREGLVIRNDANPAAAAVGGVGYLERVTLTTSPATSRRGPDGRTWVQLEAPRAGWVSNGFPNNPGNLGYCE